MDGHCDLCYKSLGLSQLWTHICGACERMRGQTEKLRKTQYPGADAYEVIRVDGYRNQFHLCYQPTGLLWPLRAHELRLPSLSLTIEQRAGLKEQSAILLASTFRFIHDAKEFENVEWISLRRAPARPKTEQATPARIEVAPAPVPPSDASEGARVDYHRYLASREFGLLKRALRERSNGVCEHCDAGPYRDTHHLTYERLGHERLDDLLAVCRPCHEYLSGNTDFNPADY